MLLKNFKDMTVNSVENNLININLQQYYDNCNDITCKIKVLKNYLEYQHLQTKQLLNKAKEIIETNIDINKEVFNAK